MEYKSILESLKNLVEGQGFCNTPSTGIIQGAGNPGHARLRGNNIRRVNGPTNLRFNHNGVGVNLTNGWRNAQGNIEITGIRLQYISGWRAGDSHTFATTNTTSLAAKYYLLIDAKVCSTSNCLDGDSQFVTNERRASDNKLSPYGVDIILEIRFQGRKRSGGDVVLLNRGRAVTCFSPNTGAARCEEMGRIWNPFNSIPENRCEPHNRCLEKKPTGSAEDVCPAQYSRLLVGYTVSPKRPRYVCSWCNDNAADHTIQNNAP